MITRHDLRLFLRFWLAELIFERILGWHPAHLMVNAIKHDNKRHNDDHSESLCYACGKNNIVGEVINIRGIHRFSKRLYFKCTDCGNIQHDNGKKHQRLHEALRKAKIIEDTDGQYRYRFFTVVRTGAVLLVFKGLSLIAMFTYFRYYR